MLQHVTGDLVTFPVQYRAHHCSSVTTRVAGITAQLFRAFPSANIYTNRIQPYLLGTIEVRGSVISMLTQRYSGNPRSNDGSLERLLAFRRCLVLIAALPDLCAIAFPDNSSCDYWPSYLRELQQFAAAQSHVTVYIVSS